MRDVRQYLLGRITQAEMAAELGMGLRAYKRFEELALAWWALALCREVRREIGDLESDNLSGKTGGYQIPGHFRANHEEHRSHAPRAHSLPRPSLLRSDERAGLLSPPRRFPRKP